MSILANAVRRKYPAPTDRSVARFLTQATYGYTYSEVTAAVANGPKTYEQWVDAQLTAGTYDWAAREAAGYGVGSTSPTVLFWDRVLQGPSTDKLRCRVWYAIIKYFPINFSVLDNSRFSTWLGFLKQIEPYILGNFRDLLEAVTKTSQMGKWLSFIGSGKATATNQPDENYAREIQQLFTIGLWELKQDGTRKTTGDLDPSDSRYVPGGTDYVPTYTLADIQGLARVFTGYGDFGSTTTMLMFSGDTAWNNPIANAAPFHETGTKTFHGVTIPANTSAAASLTIALDTLFNHPCMPPFFSKYMIQMLTTSNPSPGYVSRVASAFINNGQGVRGDIKAVVRAILLDQEARSPDVAKQPTWGRIRDCVELMAQQTIPFGPVYRPDAVTGPLVTEWAGNAWSYILSPPQTPFYPASVFGHYQTGYSPSSSFTNDNLVAPELQMWGESRVISTHGSNQHYWKNYLGWEGGTNRFKWTYDIINGLSVADTVERINVLLYGGQMSDGLRSSIVTKIGADADLSNRVRWSVAHPEYWVQK